MRISFVAREVKRVRFGGISVAEAAGVVAHRQRRTEMTGLLARWRIWVFAALMALAAAVPASGQGEPAPPTPWQQVISSQIQAFRDGDAPAAFSYAGAAFQATFPSAEVFFSAIVGSGYAPIMESVSHSFGAHRILGARGVIQEVRLIGKDQERYGAIYQLTEEEAGWRVQGVQLFKQPGLAV
jgi:hypothetical protein